MKRKSINWFKVRIIFLSCLLSVCFVLIVGRMFQLQVLKKEQLYKLAAQQHHVQIPLVPKRGTVYDSKGNELAVSIEVDSVYADARKVVDVEKTANELASILQIDREELKQRLKSHRSFEWIQRKISSKEVEQIKALQLPGISFLKREPTILSQFPTGRPSRWFCRPRFERSGGNRIPIRCPAQWREPCHDHRQRCLRSGNRHG